MLAVLILGFESETVLPRCCQKWTSNRLGSPANADLQTREDAIFVKLYSKQGQRDSKQARRGRVDKRNNEGRRGRECGKPSPST